MKSDGFIILSENIFFVKQIIIYLDKTCPKGTILLECGALNTPPETVPLDRTNGALGPLKWCIATAAMVH